MHNKKKRRLDASVNAGSMADIAFLLLIFFLVTTTILQDQGILVKLPPYEIDLPLPIHERNVFTVKVNARNELLVEGKFAKINELKSNVKEFILNPQQKEDLASNPKKAVVSLQNDRSTAYETFIEVYNELKSAYAELWEEAAAQRYQKAFAELSVAEQRTIKNDIPLIISEAEPTDFQ